MKTVARIMLIMALLALVLALVCTIVGSSANLDALLTAGIIGWLAASVLLFISIVLIVWTRTKRHEKRTRGG
ncbi:MAG: hypothetical protein PHP28_01975 [Actinomycetota bacterium]|nr:hypothetical protein [Actinomycetota bacterium]MDD5667976.1 hypothetical protein [Actinomycetota bacterium]